MSSYPGLTSKNGSKGAWKPGPNSHGRPCQRWLHGCDTGYLHICRYSTSTARSADVRRTQWHIPTNVYSQSETTILLWFHFGNEAQEWGREHNSTATLHRCPIMLGQLLG